MGNEKVLLERLKDARDKAEGIVATAENENNRGMTPDETKDFKAHMAEVARLQGELEGLQRAKDARAELTASPLYNVPDAAARTVDDSDPSRTRVQVTEPSTRAYQKGDALGAIVSARLRYGPWEHEKAKRWAEQTYGSGSPQFRALQQSSFTAGGAFIPENFVGAEFIERLTAMAQVRKAGARLLTLINGSATIPKLTGGSTGGWIGTEGANAVPSEPTTGQIKLVEKKYMVLVPFSNDLRRNSSLEMERVVRDDMITVTANDEDLAFLKGSGLSGQPKGIYNWVPPAGKSNSAGVTLANVRTDIRTAKNRLDTANAPNQRRAWFMHSRGMNYMGWDLVDGNSNFAFLSMQNSAGATLGGDPVYRDNNISITLGGGTGSEIYYAEMSELFIGDSMELEIEIIENAVYADAAGTLRSGVSRDESAIRLIRKTDFAMRHSESAYVLEAVTYGA